VLALTCMALVASSSAVTPIGKVLEMLNEMAVKGRAEKEEEAVKFSSFSQWCDDQTNNKKNEIAAGNSKIEKLNAQIAKAQARIRSLSDRIDELTEDVGRWNGDKASATAVRGREKADYEATNADYGESLDALDKAIEVLKKQAVDRPQAELMQSLLQVRSLRLVPWTTKKALSAFLQESSNPLDDHAVDALGNEDGLSVSAPEANAYEFQSGGVVQMLEKLKSQFDTEKRSLEQEMLEAQNAFQMVMQQLTDNVENGEHEISERSAMRAQTEQEKADAEADLAQTTADRDEDQKYLDDMTALCAQKRADFASRQKLREEELAALAKATEIIASGTVAGAGDKNLPALLQIRKSSMAQLRSNEMNPIQEKIAAFLADRSRSSGSQLLAMVSEKVASNPFKKVKKMIKDLIVKLMEEATAETEHKGWCDTELTTNKQTRDAKTEDVNELQTQIEDHQATIAQLTQRVADLTAAVKELDAAVAQATEDRQASKDANTQTIAEAKGAQTAVEQAIAVLKEFYAKSSQATALAQGPADDAPETFDKPYTGMLPEGGSIVDFLEVILSDFARLESDTESEEAAQVEEFKTFTFESQKDKALKENEIKHSNEKKQRTESALNSAEEELRATQEQLDKANAYYEKLKPTCVDSGITYEERVKRREEEIQSLGEALQILKGTDVNLS